MFLKELATPELKSHPYTTKKVMCSAVWNDGEDDLKDLPLLESLLWFLKDAEATWNN